MVEYVAEDQNPRRHRFADHDARELRGPVPIRPVEAATIHEANRVFPTHDSRFEQFRQLRRRPF